MHALKKIISDIDISIKEYNRDNPKIQQVWFSRNKSGVYDCTLFFISERKTPKLESILCNFELLFIKKLDIDLELEVIEGNYKAINTKNFYKLVLNYET
ncbi:MAG: hypothetical protein ACP5OG_04955 [Candidatus Nanoarchaeia archaeon]